MDKNKVDTFWSKRAKVKDPRVSTHFKKDDTHVFDLQLIRNYTTDTSEILDLGCGTCYLSNELRDEVRYIKAVDKYPEFLDHCNVSEKLQVAASDILEYKDSKKYDLILLFGVVMYFSEDDTKKIYQKCKQMLKDTGTLIVKHQCGVEDDILIDSYSEVIGDTYYAKYKHLNKDTELLKEFFEVEVIDIYPARLNPWENTHFYAFIAKNK